MPPSARDAVVGSAAMLATPWRADAWMERVVLEAGFRAQRHRPVSNVFAMTAQAPDEVLFGGERFAVTAVDGTDFFDPTAHGLQPRPTSTACYRGYICRYAMIERRLVLRDLQLASEHEPPRLGGVQPRQDRRLAWHYYGLDNAVEFTGRLLIGNGDVVDRPYLNMGFWPAWMYSEVYELTLRSGELLAAVDCSAELAAVRAELAATAAQPTPRGADQRLDHPYVLLGLRLQLAGAALARRAWTLTGFERR
jgi:hypothetical protein